MKTTFSRILYLCSFLFFISNSALAQCDISATASQLEITCGESVDLTAYGSSTGQVVLDEDFDTGGFGPGWSGTPGATNFSNPCDPGNGTPHAWMDNNTTVPRTLTSAPYDLSGATAGVTICFDLLFATQGAAAPCEGPDEPDEGVFLQYSIDGGATWIDIHYFDPNGGNDPMLTNWNTWCFPLPAAALTANTLIRWHQTADSGADYDHWGIDNVQIFQNDLNAEITWLHDGYSYGVGNGGGVNPNAVTPTTTTTYTAQIVTGTGAVCTADVTVVVLAPNYDVTVSATPTTVCSGDCSTITGTGQIIVDPGGIETYENNELELISGTPGLPGIPPFIPPTPGDITADMNINVVGLNEPTITAGMITTVCINSFNIIPMGGGSVSLADVTITLTCPSGSSITLVNAGDLAGLNINNMCFQMGAPAVSTGADPYTGTFAPAQPFDNLVGCDAEGVWNLTISGVINDFTIPLGSISGWSITFDDPPVYQPVCYQWSPTTGLSNPTDINTTACPAATTTYDLEVSNCVPGCPTQTESITITVDPCGGCIPPVMVINAPAPLCAPATLDLATTIDGASQPATITYHATLADANADINPIAQTVAASGTYFIRCEDPGDPTCFTVEQVTVAINSCCDLDVSTVVTDETCDGANDGSIAFTINGSATYDVIIDGNVEFNDVTAGGQNWTGQADGTYAVQVVDIADPTCDTTFNITINPGTIITITSEASTDITDCVNPDGTATVTATGATSYELFTSAGGSVATNGTGAFTGLNAGDYYVIASTGTCTATSITLTINNASAPVAPAAGTDATYCNGDPITDLSATAGAGGTLTWYDDAGLTNVVGTGITHTPAAIVGTTIYYVTETVAGCESPATPITITINANPTAPLAGTDATYCVGDPMTDLTATAGFGGTLNWYSDAGLTTNIGTGATLTPGTTMGTTIYYVTESVGTCVSPASQVSITITNCCDLSASSVIIDETCDAQNDGSVDFTISGSATYDIIIDGNTEFNDVNAGNYNWTNLSDGSYSVQIVNIADPTCDTTFNVVVIPGAVVAITAEASTDLTECTAPNGTITITSTGTTYELFTSAGVSVGTNATGAFTGLGAGDYYVVVSDGTCSATGSTLTINDLTASTSNTINNSVCNGDVYTFVDGSQQTITSNTSLVSILTNSVGCDSIVTENITVLQPYTVIVDTTVCEGTNYTFADNSNHVNILMDQTHTSNLTASNGCDSTVIENVTVIPNPTLDLAPSISGCEGMPIVITATTNGGTPTWNTGDVSNSITYTGTVDTFFVATVFGTCDTISDTIFVNILPPPTVDAGADVTVPLGGTVELEATSTDPNVYYTWSPSTYLSCTDCAITEAGPLGTITYIVEVTDENGCMAYDTVTVTIDGEIGLYIPNIFSPNNDGENDVFHIYGPSWKHYKLEIYNRWGGLVFSTETPGEGWDGKTNGGEECPQAVFVYKFWGGSTVGMSFERAGNVMLTR